MNSTKTFFYKARRISLLNYFTWLMLAMIPFGYIISIVSSMVISTLMEERFSFDLPGYSILIWWFLVLIGIPLLGFRNRLVFLSIDADRLQVRNVWQKTVEIYRNKIHASDFGKNGKLTLNNTILINPKGLPLKKRIEFGMIFPEWLPEHTLPLDQKEYLQWKRQLQGQWQETTTISQTAQTKKKPAALQRSISLVGLSIIIGMILWLIFSGTIRDSLSAMIPISALVFFLFFSIWGSTVYKKVQVDENGITYQFGKKKIFCRWSEIEVLAFRVAAQRLLIWNNNRYKSYSYHQIETESMEKVAQVIFEQAAIRNIPMAKV